jgi:1-deoxy-D-xylulose-5-phosphate synthase
VEFLVQTFEQIKDLGGPILVHAITQKGKGYHFTENDPLCAHGVTRYDKIPGDVPSKKGGVSYTGVYGKTVLELANTDERIVAITAAMPDNTGLTEFAAALPERMFDVGIAEQHGVTFAAGLATRGIVPMVTIYSTFLQRAYDQVIHDVAIQNLPVRFVLDRGGLVGEDGPTHHGAFDLSYLRLIPNLVIMAPADENELRHMVKTMVDYERGPIAVRFPRGEGIGVQMDPELRALPIGKAQVLSEGRDVELVAIGAMVPPCVRAAEILRARGIDTGVVNARFVKPLDAEVLDHVAASGALLVTVEDNVIAGGFGSGINEYLAAQGYDLAVVRNLGLPDRFIEHGERDDLLADLGLSAEGIAESAARFLFERRQSARSIAS